MAKIFLDTNLFLDLIEGRKDLVLEDLSGHTVFISPLSIHVLMYVSKGKVPHDKIADNLYLFSLIPFDQKIVRKALLGPTTDFEDNTQLHSAAESECEFFMTGDKKLLSLKFFGKARILQNLSELKQA